jgi:CubicO group peptidase (beta-lactamase class C family)
MADLDPTAVDALLTRARREIDAGLLPACQLALALDGEVVVHEAFGDADLDTRFCIFSATKPVVASVVWQLMAEGLVRPEMRIEEVLPGFGTKGKADVTLDHVLLHTAGFPHAPLRADAVRDRSVRAEAYAGWRLSWPVGSQYEYHALSAHWVLADVIHAVTGLDHVEAIRTRVLEPLGLEQLAVGVPLEAQGDILDLVLTGSATDPDALEAALGVRELPQGSVTDEALLSLNHPQSREVGVPGGGGVSTAADLAAFYQAVLRNTGDLWDPAVLGDVTATVRNTFPDPVLRHSANRTRGLVVAGDDGRSNLRGMGKTVSPRAFGHNGAAGQVAWADPASGLSFAYLTSGRDLDVLQESRRTTALASLAASCVVS